MNVVIVGAGIIGHAVAWEFAARGASVRLLDARGSGQGASQASAGVLAPTIEGHSQALLKLTSCGLTMWDPFMARLRQDTAHAVEYERTGTLEVALDGAQTAELAVVARHLTDAGVAHSWIEASGVRDLEPLLSDRAAAGLLIPEHGYVRVQELIDALADACVRRDVEVTVTRVQRLEDANDGQVRVITASDTLIADAVVLSAGAWSGQVAVTPSAVPVRPVRGQLLHVQMPQPPLSRVTWGRDCYLVPWRDGSVLIGATVEDAGFDEHATVDGMHQLLGSARELVPALATAIFKEVRVGLRPATADELPIVGRSSTMPAVFYATGHYRNGVLLAPLTAIMLADLILDGRERQELALVRPDRFGL